MVCVACFVIPVVLWLWHKYLQPLVVRFWGPLPWGNQEAVKENKDSTKDPGKGAIGNGCPFSNKSSSVTNGAVPNGHPPVEVKESSSIQEQNKKMD